MLEPAEIREAFALVQARYPAGTYRESAWLNAERNFRRLIDAGHCTPLALVEAAAAYCAQQQAIHKIGTQYVLRPDNFFDPHKRHWRGPFPIPKSDAEQVVENNIVTGGRQFLEGDAP